MAMWNHSLPLRKHVGSLTSCSNTMDLDIYGHYCLIPAAIIILVLSFLEKRSYKPDICNGRPALLVPLALLDGFSNRLAHSAAFGVIMNTALVILLTISLPFSEVSLSMPLWARYLWALVLALEQCVLWFPLFACISTRHKLIGGICCSVYCVIWLCGHLYNGYFAVCLLNENTVRFTELVVSLAILIILVNIPAIVCLLFLLLRSAYSVYTSLKTGRHSQQEEKSFLSPHQKQYVRCLFANAGPCLEELKSNKWTDNFRYKKLPVFRFPLRITSVAAAVILINYIITVAFVWLGVFLYELVETHTQYSYTLEYLRENVILLDLLIAIWFIMTAVTSAISFFHLFKFLKRYRYDILSMYKGKLDISLNKMPRTATILAYSIRYMGYQVAYSAWGMIFSFLALIIVGWGIAILIDFLVAIGMLEWLLIECLKLSSIPIIIIVIFVIQIFLSKYVLLQDKVRETDGSPPLNVDNRRFNEIVNYYFMFANMAVGIVSCLLRILLGAILAVFMLGRLDRSLLMQGWERTDMGYVAYLGMLHVDHAHNNPTMRVFCWLLWERILQERKQKAILERSMDTLDTIHQPRENTGKNSQARRRWFLLYTLVNNQNLCSLRKNNLTRRNMRHSVSVATKNSVQAVQFNLEKLELEDNSLDENEVKVTLTDRLA